MGVCHIFLENMQNNDCFHTLSWKLTYCYLSCYCCIYCQLARCLCCMANLKYCTRETLLRMLLQTFLSMLLQTLLNMLLLLCWKQHRCLYLNQLGSSCIIFCNDHTSYNNNIVYLTCFSIFCFYLYRQKHAPREVHPNLVVLHETTKIMLMHPLKNYSDHLIQEWPSQPFHIS
jgi:hypothetical protein